MALLIEDYVGKLLNTLDAQYEDKDGKSQWVTQITSLTPQAASSVAEALHGMRMCLEENNNE